MNLVYQIWTCDCKAERAYGFAPVPEAHYSTALLFCAKCRRNTWHRFIRLEARSVRDPNQNVLALLVTILTWVSFVAFMLWASSLYAGERVGSDHSREAWNGRVASAAERLGCRHLVWQHKRESEGASLAVYARRYQPGDCLVLAPIGQGVENVYLGYGGLWRGYADAPVPVYYLSDVPQIRIWNGEPVE